MGGAAAASGSPSLAGGELTRRADLRPTKALGPEKIPEASMASRVQVAACVQDWRTIRVTGAKNGPHKVVVRGRSCDGVRPIRHEALRATDREKLDDDGGSCGKLHEAGFRGRESITSRRRRIL